MEYCSLALGPGEQEELVDERRELRGLELAEAREEGVHEGRAARRGQVEVAHHRCERHEGSSRPRHRLETRESILLDGAPVVERPAVGGCEARGGVDDRAAREHRREKVVRARRGGRQLERAAEAREDGFQHTHMLPWGERVELADEPLGALLGDAVGEAAAVQLTHERERRRLEPCGFARRIRAIWSTA